MRKENADLEQEQHQPIQRHPTFHQGETMQNQHPILAPIHKLLQFLLLIHHALLPSVSNEGIIILANNEERTENMKYGIYFPRK